MIEPVQLPSPWRDVRLTVVVPTYNEAGNLPVLVERLLALPLPGLRILVADDNSPDGTGEVADKLAVEHPDRIQVVHRAGKEGLGRAYVDGISRALDGGAEYVAQMDADLSHPPEALPGMLGALLSTRAGVVIGSRYVPGGQLDEAWPLYRRALSGWANLYVHTLLRVRVRDLTAGFKIWRADALVDIGLERVQSNGYSFQVEMHYLATKLGHTILEVPIRFEERRDGASKMTTATKIESALMPFRLRSRHRNIDSTGAHPVEVEPNPTTGPAVTGDDTPAAAAVPTAAAPTVTSESTTTSDAAATPDATDATTDTAATPGTTAASDATATRETTEATPVVEATPAGATAVDGSPATPQADETTAPEAATAPETAAASETNIPEAAASETNADETVESAPVAEAKPATNPAPRTRTPAKAGRPAKKSTRGGRSGTRP